MYKSNNFYITMEREIKVDVILIFLIWSQELTKDTGSTWKDRAEKWSDEEPNVLLLSYCVYVPLI